MSLKSCCGCFNLRTSGLILGWLGIIFGVLNILYAFIQRVLVIEITPYDMFILETDFQAANLIYGVLFLVSESLWVCGITKNKIGVMLLSFVSSIILCVFGIMNGLIISILPVIRIGYRNKKEAQEGSARLKIIIYLLALALGLCLIIVKSLLCKQIWCKHQGLPKTLPAVSMTQPSPPPSDA